MLIIAASPPPPLSSIPAAFSFDVALITNAWMPRCFAPRPPKVSTVAGKRCRAMADLDGDGASPRPKKRRLRLHLITSRLSHPFAAPSTYINSRGAFIAARLAFRRRVGRSLLRKAALENWMRVRRGAPTPTRRQLASVGATNGVGSWSGEGIPPDDGIRWSTKTPALPSKVDQTLLTAGLSNYNAIDLEDSPFDEGSWSDAQEEMEVDIHGSRLPDEILTDALGAVYQGPKRAWLDDPAQSYPYWSLLTEEDRHREVSFAVFSKRPRV